MSAQPEMVDIHIVSRPVSEAEQAERLRQCLAMRERWAQMIRDGITEVSMFLVTPDGLVEKKVPITAFAPNPRLELVSETETESAPCPSLFCHRDKET